MTEDEWVKDAYGEVNKVTVQPFENTVMTWNLQKLIFIKQSWIVCDLKLKLKVSTWTS